MWLNVLLITYFTNAACTLSVLLSQHPISVRLLGPGKTIEGLLLGLNAGLIIGFILGVDFRFNFIISSLALLGDLIGSFIKRRIGVKDVFILDQVGFMILPLIYARINLITSLLILLVTIVVHRIANIIAYHLGLKSVPY